MDNCEKSGSGNPLVTVITVTLNNREGLESTVRSVLGQEYGNIQYIIIDGGSVDGSVELIEKFSKGIDYRVSAPDKGIYDAMNRGIVKARGEWTVFMNAGDVFYSRFTVKNVARRLDTGADLVYGSFLYFTPEYGNLLSLRKPGRMEDLWKGMVFSHQALFCKTSILKKEGFDCGYRYCADYALVCEARRRGYKFRRVDDIIAIVSSGGASHVNRFERRLEQVEISRKYGTSGLREAYFSLVLAAVRITSCMKRFLPYDFVSVFIRARRGRLGDLLRRFPVSLS